MFKCIECGYEFEEPRTWSENRGEYWGVVCFEEMNGCPKCCGDYEELHPCEICGINHTEDEIIEGVCEECVNDYRNDFDTCYEISLGMTEPVQINSLLASLFEPSEIDAILKAQIKNNCLDINCSSFIDGDISWFAKQLSKEVNKK